MRKLLLLIALSLLTFQAAWAQRTVSGQVTEDDGTPLQGVAVVAKGTNTGAFTDSDGQYSLDVPDGVTTLVFRYVGKQLQEVEITGSTMNVTMADDNVYLDEVVVTALGI